MEALFGPNMPALAPPPGQTSDFHHPEAYLLNAQTGLAVVISLVSACLISIRIFTNVVLIKQWHIEDYASITAVLLLVGWIAVGLNKSFAVQVTSHMWNVRIIDIPHVLYYMGTLITLYCPIMLTGKMAIMLQLRRLFCVGPKDAFAYCLYISMIINTIFYVLMMFIEIFRCNPRDKAWNILKPGTCMDQLNIVLTIGIFNAVSDYALFVLPLWAVTRLQLNSRRKLGVLAVFGVGIFTCILASIGLFLRVALYHESDVTIAFCRLGMYGVSEASMLIWVGCAPSLPRFWRYMTGEDKKSHGSNEQQHKQNLDTGSTIQLDERRATISGRRYNGSPKKKSNPLHSMAKYMRGGDDILIEDDAEALRTMS